jgi:bifunctional non-homologous end joining protein LigD
VRRAGNIPPSIPTRAAKPPAGPDWVQEIKHDGYRLIVRRDDAAVRLFMRRGYDWSERYPAIARAAWKLRAKSFTLNREAAVCAGRTASPSSTRSTAVARSLRPCCTPSICWSWTASTIGRCRSASGRNAHLVDRRLTGIVMNDHAHAHDKLVFQQASGRELSGNLGDDV